MFDWFWNFLYGISKSMYRIIDFLLSCANMLCGIEPIKYQGVETDFLTFLLSNQNITYGFIGAVLIAVVLTIIFGVAALIKAIASEKSNLTPAQVLVKVGKTLLMFLFIPICLSVLVYFTNILMQTLYMATSGGSSDGLGRFLAGAFGQDALKGGVSENFYLSESFNYTSTGNVRKYLDLTDYDYFFSWICSFCIILSLGTALLSFIDRAISIAVLFIFSPISISASVIDDGGHFKLWRDQFLVKFLMGYGCIIAINIYAMIVVAISSSNLEFFSNNLLNNFMKILLIVGGAVSMQRMMALIGNLVSSGAGSNELRDTAIAGASMRSAFGGATRFFTSPFRATRSAANFIRDSKQYGTLSTIGQRLGFRTNRDYGVMSNSQLSQSRDLMREREKLRRQSNASFFGGGSSIQKVLEGDKKGAKGGGNGANNNKAPAQKKENPIVNNAIANSMNKDKNDKK